jgi:hypothetical protein
VGGGGELDELALHSALTRTRGCAIERRRKRERESQTTLEAF